MVGAVRVLNVFELSPDYKFYRCGSPNQKNFLIENGMEYIYSYRSNKTGRVVWVFIECEKLSSLLSVWSMNKPKGGDGCE